jgi:hypothetical protein
MNEPTSSRPVPGPPRPGPGPVPAEPSARTDHDDAAVETEDPVADLEGRPVAEHVDVFETEHARLERELGTIDRL